MHFCFVFGLEPWLLPPAVEMADTLNAQGHSVKIIYAQYTGVLPDSKDYDTTYTHQIIPRQTGFKRFFIHRYINGAVRKLLAKNQVDVLIACDIISLQAVAAIKEIKKGYWGFEIVNPPKQLKLSLYIYRASRFPKWMGQLNFFLAPSESRAEKIASRLRRKIPHTTIYNCRRLTNNTAQQNELKKLIYTGRVSATQYIDEMIDAMELLEKDMNLHIAGPASEEYTRQLQNRIENNRLLHGRVFLHGRLSREDVYALTATAGIGFVFYNGAMSDEANDPAPNKLSDYIAASVWSIGGSQPYIKYWLEERGAGVCIDQISKSSIAEAAKKILTDDKFKNRQVLENLHHNELNMKAQAEKLLALLKNL